MLDRDVSLHPASLSSITTMAGSEIMDANYDSDDSDADVLKSRRCFWCIIP
jgi:hypothetical protein